MLGMNSFWPCKPVTSSRRPMHFLLLISCSNLGWVAAAQTFLRKSSLEEVGNQRLKKGACRCRRRLGVRPIGVVVIGEVCSPLTPFGSAVAVVAAVADSTDACGHHCINAAQMEPGLGVDLLMQGTDGSA
eukprot:1095889-Amphidinium_carterae.4